jgi:MFS family permease
LGFVTIFTGVGQAVGPYIGGLMEDAFSSLGPAYLLSGGIYLLGALLALRLRDARPGS